MKTSRLKNVLKHMEENKIPQLIVTSAINFLFNRKNDSFRRKINCTILRY